MINQPPNSTDKTITNRVITEGTDHAVSNSATDTDVDTMTSQLDSDITERAFYKLPAKALWQMRLRAVISSLVYLMMLLGIGFVLKVVIEVGVSWTLLIVVFLLIWLLIVAIYWLLSKLEYDYTAFHLGEDGLIIRKGMLWRSETFALRSRVQHIDVTQDPMSRLFGLATIKVYTAGTKLGSITLSGLDKDTAESIRNQLITQATDTL